MAHFTENKIELKRDKLKIIKELDSFNSVHQHLNISVTKFLK